MIPQTEEEKLELQRKTAFDVAKLKEFLTNNKEFLYSNEVIGVFTLGVLVNLIFSIQWKSLGSTPFENKLKGLDLSPADLKQIYKEGISKINQYLSATAYMDFRILLAETFVTNISSIARLTSQEVSFYFVAGIELGRTFRSEKDS